MTTRFLRTCKPFLTLINILLYAKMSQMFLFVFNSKVAPLDILNQVWC